MLFWLFISAWFGFKILLFVLQRVVGLMEYIETKRRQRRDEAEAASSKIAYDRIMAASRARIKARQALEEQQRREAAERKAHKAQQAMKVLGLHRMPQNVYELKSARNIVMLEVHPDISGGDPRIAVAVNDAYTELLHSLGLQDPRHNLLQQ